MKIIAILMLAALGLTACSQPAPPPQQVTVQCPPDATCDVNVTPPPMTPQQIQYHADRGDIAEDVLLAMMMQDMAWRQCYGCYSGYYSRYPRLQTQVYYVGNLPSNQRANYIQQNNTTVIQKNTTVIQQVAAKDPPAVKAAPATVSGQSSGVGGGNAATNKSLGNSGPGNGGGGGTSLVNNPAPINPAPAKPANPAPANPAPAQPKAPAAPPPPSTPKR